MGGWCTKDVSNPYGVSLWKFIRTGWLAFSKVIRFDVRDGTRVKLWQNGWYGDYPLKEAFLLLYNISQSKESTVADVMVFSDGRLHWDVLFFHLVLDWELEPLAFFMDIIYSMFVRGNGLEQSCWKPT